MRLMCNFTKTFVQPGYHWSPQGMWVYDPGQRGRHRALGVTGLLTSHLWVPPRRGQAGLCRRAGIVISSPRLPSWPAVIEETASSALSPHLVSAITPLRFRGR